MPHPSPTVRLLDHTRFVAQSSDRDRWLEAREQGVTATLVAKAATDSGMRGVLWDIANPGEGGEHEVTDYMRFGVEYEPYIMRFMKKTYGIMPNDWLIRSEEHDWMMATPDGLSLDHSVIAEVKTTGKDWGELKHVPIGYRRQVQWQLHCTDAEKCYFGYLLRTEVDGRLEPAWFEPKVFVIERDQKMIDSLIETAKQVQTAKVMRDQEEMEMENG
jgi:putative phage-type endonuclease